LKPFWDTAIVRATLEVINALKNRRITKRPAEDWTADDLWAFMGLILYFGVVKYPQRGMSWQGDRMLSDEFVQSAMCFRKFNSMLSFFRHAAAIRVPERERKEKSREDGLWTAQNFLTLLSDNYLKQRTPYQDSLARLG
jgi:hypothetical protein